MNSFFLKIRHFFLIILIVSLAFHGPAFSSVFGDVDGVYSTVEINSSTTNGPDLSDNDYFGESVTNIGDLNADGVNDIAVGANGDNNGGDGKGAIHIMYMNTDGSVDSTVEINSSTTNGPELDDSDNFGVSVTSIGDLNADGVNDIAVGANGDDNGKGAIHIMYMNTDGSVDSTVEINSSTTNGPELGTSDWFGLSITNIGDLNADGVNDIAVGASPRGAIYIMYMNTDGSVDSTVEINSSTTNGPDLSDNDYFGSSVTSIGDLNADGVNDIAVGANGDDNGKGAIHIMYMNTDGSVDSTVEINSSTTNGPELDTPDNFGISITNIGDLNADGVNDIAVGAYADGNGGDRRGAIHIMYMNTDGSVDSTVEINSSTTNGPELSDADLFGRAITNIGDLNADGIDDIAVGAFYDDNGGSDRGAIHIIYMNTDNSISCPVSTPQELELGSENEICKIIVSDEQKFCFLFWCW